MHAELIPPAGSSLRAPGFHRNERALLPFEVLRIHFREMRPLLRQIIQCEDGRNRADWHACTTIDALDWIDVKLRHGLVIHLVLLRVDAVHRAGIHTAVSLVPMQSAFN